MQIVTDFLFSHDMLTAVTGGVGGPRDPARMPEGRRLCGADAPAKRLADD